MNNISENSILSDLKITFKVFKIFAANIGTFANFNFNKKAGGKAVVKNIFLGLLMLYAFGMFFVMYSFSMLNLYTFFEASGNLYNMPLAAISMSFILTIFFGFVSVASNYYTGNGEEYFSAMPLKPINIFGGKFGVSFVTDAIFGVVMISISGIIYAYKRHLFTNPLFYVGVISTSISITLTAIFVIYLIFIVLLTIAPKLRKKNILTGIATIFILVFSLSYGSMSSGFSFGVDIDNIAQSAQFRAITNVTQLIGDKIKFVTLLANAYEGNPFSILYEIAVCLIIIFVFLPALSPLYIKTLDGFADVKTKKLNSEKANEVLQKEAKEKSILSALYWRDIKTVFREPAFFSNGPLMVFLLPVIFSFSAVIGVVTSSGNNFSEFRNELMNFVDSYFLLDKYELLKFYLILGGGAAAALFGNSANIASTAFSREGKSLNNLRSMPIDNNVLLEAKLLHAFTYPIIACILICLFLGGMNLFIGSMIPLTDLLSIFVEIIFIALSLSIILIFADMFLDTMNPKLDWDNPTAAFKQNFNSLFSVLILFAVISIIAVISIYVLPKTQKGIMILGVIFVILGVPVGRLYWRYALKKIPLM